MRSCSSPGARNTETIMAAQILKFISSLRLTVVLLGFSLVLVFVGTIAQVEHGLWDTQVRFFRSMFVYWTPTGGSFGIPVLPGGYLLGWALLVNLLAAHYVRFKFAWSKLGIFMTHFGMIFLLLGQFFTEQLQVESSLRLQEGQSKNYSEASRNTELVFIDKSHPDHDTVVAIPQSVLAQGGEIIHPDLPFTVKVEEFHLNSRLRQYAPMVATNPPASTRGIGAQAELLPVGRATSMDEINVPSAVLSFQGEGAPTGTWLVSLNLEQPQTIIVGEKQYETALRFTRLYVPYSIQLLDFRHDKYIGTERPKNFSSEVRLRNPETGEDREVLIRMNEPLRYAGITYFQASFEKGRDDITILQVVRNPAWLTPYISVIIIGLGLTVQFSMHLFKFASRRKSS
jgi:hypothetical protein